ncbi:MAG: glycine cleavage system aminomethyltransferase GcvT, partial [Deltaproteobacteria bacterium]|nr:glycine cleavage system aminomethyltransferase GcvT [Deltaproteobacteria bacterium]
GLFDVSHMGELVLEGAEAARVVDELVTNDVSRLVPGAALYTVACNSRGTILDDLIVYRQADDRFLVVCNASNRDKMVAHFAAHAKGRCGFEDRSDQIALIALQGPRALDVALAAGAEGHVRDLGAFRFADFDLGGVRCTVARTGYTGEDGFEIFCPPDGAERVWQALLEGGRAHGIAPAGLGARDTLRLEAKLCLYGNDIDETTTPYEAGLAWVVKLDKGIECLGADVLRREKAAGSARRLVGFEMTGRGIARHGYPIVIGGEKAGVVTSGSPGPTVGKNVGLGYVPATSAAIGTTIGIEIRGQVIDAVIVKTPFYKRAK